MHRRFATAGIAALLIAASASAQTWNVPTSGTWSTASNWNPVALPTSAATTALTFSGSSQYTATLDLGAATAAFNFKTLTFNSSYAGVGTAITLDRLDTRTLNLADATGGLIQNGTGNVSILAPLSIVNTSNAVVQLVSGTGSGDILLASITVGSNSQTFTFAGNFNVAVASVTKINGNKTWTNNLAAGKVLNLVDLKLNATTQNNQFIVDGTGATAITGNITELTIAGILVKNGTGTLTVSGNNSYSGATTIGGGVLSIQSLNALGTTAGATTVASGAALHIQGGFAFPTEALSLAGNGVATTGALRSISGNNTWAGAITLTGNARIHADQESLTITGGIGGAFNLTLGGNGNVTVNTVGISTGAAKTLTKVGTGIVTLNTANTYSGATTVSAGTLVQGNAGALGTSNAFTIGDGAVLDASLAGLTITAGGSLTAGRTTTPASDILGNISLTGSIFNVGGVAAATYTHAGNLSLDTASLVFGLGATTTPGSGISDLVVVNGNLTFTGTSTVALTGLGGPLATGSYTLFTYTGTFTGDATNFAAPTGLPPGRSTYGYDTTSTPGRVLLTVTGAAGNLTWVGNGTTNPWDHTTTGVWTGATPDTFFDGDVVNFTDSGSANSPVNLVGSLQPFNVAVNSANNYTFAGTGSIAGTATLTKDGAGTLTIQTANTYTGLTTVTAGIVNIENIAALGDVAGGTVVADGATLQFQGGLAVAEPLTLNGNGLGSAGALRSISGANSWTGPIVLGSAARITVAADSLTLSGVVSGTFTLTKDGPGTLQLTGTAANTHSGTTVLAGLLELNKTPAINAIAGILTIGDGTNPATVRLLAINQISNTAAITVNANATFDLNGNSETVGSIEGSGSVTLGAALLSLNAVTTTTFNGVIAGNGTAGLSRLNGGTTILGGLNTYSGTTNIQNDNSQIRIAVNDALPTTTTLTSLGTTNTNVVFDLNGKNQTIAALTSSTTTGQFYIQNNSGAGTSVLTITNGTGTFTATTGQARIRDNDGIVTGGTVALTITGGTTTFGRTQTYTGITTISGGTLKGGIANIIAASTSVDLGASGTFDLNGFNQSLTDLQGSGTVTSAAAANLTVTTANFSGLITGATSLVKGNAGTATITGIANTFTGSLTANNGTLEIYSLADSGAGANGVGAIRVLSGNNATATLRYLGVATTITRAIDVFATGDSAGNANIDASGTGPLIIGGASRSGTTGTGIKTLVLQGSNLGDNTVNGIISDGTLPLGLGKSGPGTWVVPGNNTYTGTTAITGGLLKVNGQTGSNSGTGTGAVSVGDGTANSGTLAGNGQIAGALAVNTGGTLSPGNDLTAIAPFTVGISTAAAPNVAINGTLKLHFDVGVNSSLAVAGNAPGTFDFGAGSQLVLASSPAFQTAFDAQTPHTWNVITLPDGATATGLTNPTFDVTTFAPAVNGTDFSLSQTGNTVVLAFTPVPEPVAILGIAAIALGAFRRRRQIERRSTAAPSQRIHPPRSIMIKRLAITQANLGSEVG